MPDKTSSSPRRGTFSADVLENARICDQHFRMVLGIAGMPATGPGQFVQLRCRSKTDSPASRPVDWPEDGFPRLTGIELTGRTPLLRRPFSLAGRRDRADGTSEIDIVYRAIGAGTGWLAGVKAGETVDVLGPLGNPFTLRAPKRAAIVGGGAGLAPLLYLAATLGRASKAVVAFCGARSASLLPLTISDDAQPSKAGLPKMCVEQFAAMKIQSVVATDDGSVGYRGLVSEAFGRWIAAAGAAGGELVVYACGPEPMMRAVAGLCLSRGIDCQLAMERNMACGMGTCQSCIVKVRDEGPDGWSYKLCCSDGPVFNAADIIWE